LLLGLAFNLFRLRHRPAPIGCKQSQLVSNNKCSVMRPDLGFSSIGEWIELCRGDLPRNWREASLENIRLNQLGKSGFFFEKSFSPQ
jgi:hypothetical protein